MDVHDLAQYGSRGEETLVLSAEAKTQTYEPAQMTKQSVQLQCYRPRSVHFGQVKLDLQTL